MASFREAPSGRGLLDDGVSEMSSVPVLTGQGGSVYVSEPSEGSASAWNDSDAQSGYPYGGRGGGSSAAAYQTEAASNYHSSETASEAFHGQVGLTEDDLDVSEGSAAASRLEDVGGGARGATAREVYGSESTYEERSVIGGESYMSASPAPGSRTPGRQQATLQLHGSSNSSLASRVVAPKSEIGHQVIVGENSWRSSPMPEMTPGGGFERMSSGDTTDSSNLMEQNRRRQQQQRQRGEEEHGDHQDGDFGSVWLANRAHARQFDDEPGGS